jgi:AraC-like DNA-binding protein
MDFQILEINGEDEHIHALIEYPPKLSVSKIVNALKGVSSRRYGQAGFRKPHGKTALWSPSYFAVSVGGAPIETLIQYIKEQSRQAKDGACIPLISVIQCRVEQARILLQRRELTIGEIATLVGFNDQSHFTHHFRRITGVTPKQFLQE